MADPSRVALDVCEALGIDPGKTESITLSFGPEGAFVTVESIVTDEETKQVAKTLQKYALVEKNDG